MYFILHLTERCNLECVYCETKESRGRRAQDIQYDISDLITFLRGDPQLSLQLYGGEPMLALDLIERVLDEVPTRHVCLQTNAFYLDRLPARLFDRIDVLSVSIDGPPQITDTMRGPGVYDTVVRQTTALRERGYAGKIDARMTTSPGVDIYAAVTHLLDDCPFHFDSIYWQLNVLFGVEQWRFDRKFIEKWHKQMYRPQLRRLIDRWVDNLVNEERLERIIPFCGVMHDILGGASTAAVRCGAGVGSWTVTPSGELFPCPVLRESPDFCAGTVASIRPADIVSRLDLRAACEGCEALGLCGGRCIYANLAMRWGPEGFALICAGTKGMIRALRAAEPKLRRLLERGAVGLEDLASVGYDYEVIP